MNIIEYKSNYLKLYCNQYCIVCYIRSFAQRKMGNIYIHCIIRSIDYTSNRCLLHRYNWMTILFHDFPSKHLLGILWTVLLPNVSYFGRAKSDSSKKEFVKIKIHLKKVGNCLILTNNLIFWKLIILMNNFNFQKWIILTNN